MRDPLSSTIKTIQPSGIRKFFDIVSEMKDAISLGVGEPDFDTPWHIRDEGIYSLEKGRTFYTSNAGLKELKIEIARYLDRRYGMTYDYNKEIMVTVGGTEAIDIALRAMLDAGDEVIIPQPSYVSYVPCTVLAGGTPVIVELKEENDFRLTAEELEAVITPKTKILIMPFPNNPTGAIMEKADLEAIVQVVKEHDLFVISDEIYSELTYVDKHVSIASFPGMKERTVLINGFSKAYAMPGWRIGYSAAPLEVTTAIKAVQGHVTSAANSIAQKAALEALSGPQDTVAVMCGEYARRRSRVAQLLQEIPGVRFSMPSGAFYFWVDVSAYLGKSHGGKKINTAVDLANFLLEQAHAAVVPGEAFHMPGSIRISYANSMKNIELALTAIKEALALL